MLSKSAATERKVLVFVPYTLGPMDNAPRVRAYNMCKALTKFASPVFVIGKPFGNYHLMHSNQVDIQFPCSRSRVFTEMNQILKHISPDFIYVEAMASSLYPFDYFFLKRMVQRGIPIFPFIRDFYWRYRNTLQETWRQRIWFSQCDREFSWYLGHASGLLFPSQQMADTTDYPRKYILPPAGDPSRCVRAALPDNQNIVFVGGISQKMGIDLLASAMEYVVRDHPKAHCTFVGDGDTAIIRRWERNPCVSFVTGKNYFEIPEILSDSYLTVIPHPVIPHNDFAIPVKLFDYMSSARPVVSTNCMSTARFIQENNIGVVTPDNPKSLAEGIVYLLDNPETAREYGKNAIDAIKKGHSWCHRVKTLLDIADEAG